jgi:hypothetical protein
VESKEQWEVVEEYFARELENLALELIIGTLSTS